MRTDIDPREVMAAGCDILLTGLGHPPQSRHPFAGNCEITLADLAYACGAAACKPQTGEFDRAVMGRGMGTVDFSRLLSEAGQAVVSRTYNAAADHLSYTSIVAAKDFRHIDLPGLDADIRLDLLNDISEFTHADAPIAPGAQAVQLVTYGRALHISRQVVINDAFGFLRQLFSNIGASGSRREAELVGTQLESAQVLDDGAVVFNATNTLASVLSAEALGAAMALMRNALTPAGQKADLAAKHLIVSSELEFFARTLVRDSGAPLEVHALAPLPAGRWFMLADPQIQPVIGLLRLAGSKTATPVEPAVRRFEHDGVAVKLRADLGCVLLSRTGIVKAGADLA